ncbi:MAG: hypothetical protein RBS39_02950 [Phycisphaerales bacterium]|jgi:hypothetical protein|nr:hypothetical protein [Phycisphaerales bacterium]
MGKFGKVDNAWQEEGSGVRDQARQAISHQGSAISHQPSSIRDWVPAVRRSWFGIRHSLIADCRSLTIATDRAMIAA